MIAKHESRTFAEWLESEMEHRGMNMSELGRRGGITHGRISQVVTLGESPGWEMVAAVARAFDLPLEYVAHIAGHWPEYTEDPEADTVRRRFEELTKEKQEIVYDLMESWVERHRRGGSEESKE